MSKIGIWLIVLNILTCLVARSIHGGRLKVVTTDGTDLKLAVPRVWLIAGMQAQAEPAFRFIDFGDYERVFLHYSCLGFNPKWAGRQLRSLLRADDVICGVSVGAQPIEYAIVNRLCKCVMINPCCRPASLKPGLRRLLRVVTPCLEVLSYGLGWLAVLPLIPADFGKHISLALLADQLFWLTYGEPELQHGDQYKVILSTQDEFLDNAMLRKIYAGAATVEINTRHGFIGSEKAAELYDSAIKQLIQ